MVMSTLTTTAALRSRIESPFVLPAGAHASWLSRGFVPSTATGGHGFARGTSSPDATLMATPPQTAGADARIAAKQARPPRGVPR
jgi:hypothetical protein